MVTEGLIKRRQQMVGSVSRRSVGVPVPVVARQQPFECGAEVAFRARSHLHEGEPGCRVGNEDVDQPVVALGAEPLQFGGQVQQARTGGVDVDLRGPHRPILLPCATGGWPEGREKVARAVLGAG